MAGTSLPAYVLLIARRDTKCNHRREIVCRNPRCTFRPLRACVATRSPPASRSERFSCRREQVIGADILRRSQDSLKNEAAFMQNRPAPWHAKCSSPQPWGVPRLRAFSAVWGIGGGPVYRPAERWSLMPISLGKWRFCVPHHPTLVDGIPRIFGPNPGHRDPRARGRLVRRRAVPYMSIPAGMVDPSSWFVPAARRGVVRTVIPGKARLVCGWISPGGRSHLYVPKRIAASPSGQPLTVGEWVPHDSHRLARLLIVTVRQE
jgi:hypothetical protein